MSRYLDENLRYLSAYKPGEQPVDRKYIKLNTNESPFPPPKDLVVAVKEAATGLNLYPDPELSELKKDLASIMPGYIRPENIFISNGSDDILYFAFRAFTGEERMAAFPEISYGFYEVFARFRGCPYRMLPLRSDFRIDLEDYKDLGETDRVGLILIANPNAPTGISLCPEEIEKIVRGNPNSVVLIDEAYVDFGARSCVGLVGKYDNVIITRTFSKSASLAGARLGFAMASTELIRDLELIKYSINPYSVNRMTEAAGRAVIKNIKIYRANCLEIRKTREWSVEELEKMGFNTLPSQANFLLTGHPAIGGRKLYEELKERGILVRYFDKAGLSDKIRLTIGSDREMKACMEALKDIIKEAEREKR
jgi:histidinol-phosphate aminotransferase